MRNPLKKIKEEKQTETESPALSPEHEETPSTAVEAPPISQVEDTGNEGEMISTLQKLREEIDTLNDERAHVIEVGENLRVKIEAEIEAKKRSIESLKTEIPVLKQKCEQLAGILEIPVRK
jgi:predicted RNase H-like nuclease (RuvC/YqgF family)